MKEKAIDSLHKLCMLISKKRLADYSMSEYTMSRILDGMPALNWEEKYNRSEELIEIINSSVSEAEILERAVESETGYIKEFESDLIALKEALMTCEFSRLKQVLDEDVIYESVNRDSDVVGIDNVCHLIKYVTENSTHKYYVYSGTIEDESKERCIILAMDEETHFTDMVRIEVNEKGFITRINVSHNPAIGFSVEYKFLK